ncbi:MAG: SUMF1/EgtB/PvdO family nonheme iron enzyme [Methylococcales bacterium]|nr:SUMF1/EgtB/PvdO family nonheme iron enzyme [Methylococcales bacterium]
MHRQHYFYSITSQILLSQLASCAISTLGDFVKSGSNRVNRGGSWNNNASNSRSANRNNNSPDNRNNNIGFRLRSTGIFAESVSREWLRPSNFLSRHFLQFRSSFLKSVLTNSANLSGLVTSVNVLSGSFFAYSWLFSSNLCDF